MVKGGNTKFRIVYFSFCVVPQPSSGSVSSSSSSSSSGTSSNSGPSCRDCPNQCCE